MPSLPSRTFDPLINIDFGGPKDCCEVSLFINSQAGERINQVGIIERKGSIPVKVLPSPQPSHCITGLVAKESDVWGGSTCLNHPYQGLYGGIAGIGIQSQLCDDASTSPDSEICQYIRNAHVPDDQIRYDREFARLIDMDRSENHQSASVGTQERSRSSDVISGLKFEYFHDEAAEVLGQWIHEIDGAFELSKGEKLQSLTVSLKPVGFASSIPTQEICQIAAIHIETCQSRRMTFRASRDESELQKRSMYQSQCDLGETMVAISWIFNMRADWLRSITSRSHTNQQMIMVPELPAPWDQTQKLYFSTPKSAYSPSERVIAAKASIQIEAIVGISFLYSSGKVSEIGNLEGTTSTISFPENSRIVGFSIELKDKELKAIPFELDTDSTSTSIRLCVESPKNITTAAYPDIN
ncbi:hypothetical protein N7540_000165 [Penicillium herquei]|nr:hypothetical protein N7540_000165 [Penicillium herquei]